MISAASVIFGDFGVAYRAAKIRLGLAAGAPILPPDVTTSLWALFASSLLAATLLPGGSEAVLYVILELHPEITAVALAVATLGNTLGGLSSYALGRLVARVKPLKGLALVERYGSPALLLSWVPLVGDPLCVAAGWLRIHAGWATLYMALGKLARYLVIAFALI